MKRSTLFHLSTLQLALIAGFAHANDVPAPSTTLSTVNVTATSNKPVENWQEWSKSTSTDIKDVLADQVAIQFGGGNGASQWVTIRGMGQDQIDYVVDGFSSDTQIFHHQGRFMLDPALVKVINIEKGTGSASSGIGATSGKIEAKTLDAADLLSDGQNVGLRVNAGINSNKGHNSGFAVYGRQNGFDGILIGNWVSNDNYKAGNGQTVTNSALGGRSWLGKIAYSFNPDHRLELSHRREEEYGFRNLREEFDLGERNDPSYRHRTSDVTNLAYSGRNAGFVNQIEANIFYGKTTQESEPGQRINTFTKAQITTSGGNLNLTSKIGEHRIKYGINHRHQEGQLVTNNFGGQEKTDVGVYAEGIWNLQPITLTTGLRYDHFKFDGGASSQSDGNLNPSIGIIWDVQDNLSLRASYNIASRSPRMREVLLVTSPLYLRNNLRAERSRTAEVGFDYRHSSFGLSGSYFLQKINHLQNIADPTGQRQRYESWSEGSLKNHGYELNGSYRWQGLTARIGVAHSKPSLNGTTYDSVATAIPMGRQWMTSLSYRFNQPHLEIGWRGRYSEKGEYIDASRGSGTAVARSGYGVHDIYANWQPTGKDNFNVNFAINNVGNKTYRSQSQRSGTNSLLETGRDIRLGVNYRF